jgi:hypothetical protein
LLVGVGVGEERRDRREEMKTKLELRSDVDTVQLLELERRDVTEEKKRKQSWSREVSLTLRGCLVRPSTTKLAATEGIGSMGSGARSRRCFERRTGEGLGARDGTIGSIGIL